MNLSLLFIVFSLVILCKGGYSKPPIWAERYNVQGIIHIPFSEIEEPFEAWYDASLGLSRIDYYSGTVSTVQKENDGDFGIMYKIVPYTDEEVMNTKKCLMTRGSCDEPVEVQSILPDMTNFKLILVEWIDNKEIEKWQFIDSKNSGDNNSTYTMWVEKMKIHDGDIEAISVPIRFEMRGYNFLSSSHQDHYYLTYFNYKFMCTQKRDFRVPISSYCEDITETAGHSRIRFNPMLDLIPPHSGHKELHKEFENFKIKHNKVYKNDEEHNRKKSNFIHNYRFIESKNRANLRYKLKLNHFADSHTDDLKYLTNRISNVTFNGGFSYKVNESLYNLKENGTFDWRLYGAVTPVKDQAICGSCWSFSAVGAIEAAYFLKYKKLMKFSEQALIDCSWGFGNLGCDGGLESGAYQWVMKHNGIPTDNEYGTGSYLGEDGICYNTDSPKIARIRKYYNVQGNNSKALRIALLKKGPIAIAIDASPNTFYFYSSGIYDDAKCESNVLNHAVLLVGYGHRNGKLFWIVKNSWSTHWGNDGYILIDAEKNICGVLTEATFVELE